MRRPSKTISGRIKRSFRKWRRPAVVSIDGVLIHADPEFFGPDLLIAIYGENYEWQERRLARCALRMGDRVLEIGAGIGLVSLLAARLIGAGNLRLYEANPALEPIIRRNFELNGICPDLHMRAVAPTAGLVTFHLASRFISSSLKVREDCRQVTVQADSIADVLTDFQPNVIIMDAEGAEVDLLKATDLSSIDRIVLETHPHVVGKSSIVDLMQHLQSVGYSIRQTIEDVVLLTR